jgi:hypothetical protein
MKRYFCYARVRRKLYAENKEEARTKFIAIVENMELEPVIKRITQEDMIREVEKKWAKVKKK